MALSPEEVRHIARLARVGVTAEDVERFSAQLSVILDHFTALAAVETGDLEPTAHPLPLANVMREDEVRPSLPRHEVLQNAPDQEEGLFRVRAVLE